MSWIQTCWSSVLPIRERKGPHAVFCFTLVSCSSQCQTSAIFDKSLHALAYTAPCDNSRLLNLVSYFIQSDLIKMCVNSATDISDPLFASSQAAIWAHNRHQ